MNRSKNIALIHSSLLIFIGLGCNTDHHPEKNNAAIKEERLNANKPRVVLAADGTMPGKAAEVKGTGNVKFDTICSSCHGLDGKASTAAAKALKPSPRNFTDALWQKSVDDARIAKVIKEGGASVGLSSSMAPFGGMLSDAEVQGLVATIRSLGTK